MTLFNEAPAAFLSAQSTGLQVTVTFGANDFSDADQQAGFRYVIDWGNGTITTLERAAGNGSGEARSHVYAQTGNYTIRVTAQDQDGATSAEASEDVSIEVSGDTIAGDLQAAVDALLQGAAPEGDVVLAVGPDELGAVVEAVNGPLSAASPRGRA
jgi:hypothetical protein